MTTVQPVLDEVEPDPSEESPRGGAQRGARFDALALQQLLAPVRGRTLKAQLIQVIASAATVVPFVGIVELGRELLADGPVSTARVWTIVAVVVAALLVRTVASGTALTITHFRTQAQAAAGRLQRLLETRTLRVVRNPQVPQSNSVEFDAATISYDGQRSVLNDVAHAGAGHHQRTRRALG